MQQTLTNVLHTLKNRFRKFPDYIFILWLIVINILCFRQFTSLAKLVFQKMVGRIFG